MFRRLGRLRWLVVVLTAAAVGMVIWFYLDIRRAYARIAQHSATIPWGNQVIEYAEGGKGTPVLVVHGSGGGFDQGQLIAEAVLGDDAHWIAPSRMGYLQSTLPAGADFSTQAEAYVALLDALGIRKTAVVAMSQGGPSALYLAAHHPERVSSLVLLSCGVASSSSDSAQADADAKGDALVKVFSHDMGYWLISTFFQDTLLSLMGVDASVSGSLTPGQQALARRVIDEMNPVAPRAAGVALDNRASMPNEAVKAITAPTLIVHARDDGLQLFRNAEYAAQHVPDARLIAYDKGGHLLLVVQQVAIGREVRSFVSANAPR